MPMTPNARENDQNDRRRAGGLRALLVCAATLLLAVAWVSRGEAWVPGYQPFPEGEATVVMRPYCRVEPCSYYLGLTSWETDIQHALRQWNSADAGWRFHEEWGAGRPADPCRPRDGQVIIIIAIPDQLCPGDGPLRSDALTELGSGWARIYLSTRSVSVGLGNPSRLLLHELGHAVGLGHPDEHGQSVRAVMNSVIYFNQLQPDDLAGVRALYPVETTPPPPSSAGNLEIPGPGTTLSGIGLISGWKCTAGELTVRFNGDDPLPLLYGAERKDVQDAGACDSAEVGFVSVMNWGNLGAGTHNAVVYDDGVEFDRSTFTVVTIGQAFVEGLAVRGLLDDFPHQGEQVVLEWRESLQNFVIVEHRR